MKWRKHMYVFDSVLHSFSRYWLSTYYVAGTLAFIPSERQEHCRVLERGSTRFGILKDHCGCCAQRVGDRRAEAGRPVRRLLRSTKQVTMVMAAEMVGKGSILDTWYRQSQWDFLMDLVWGLREASRAWPKFWADNRKSYQKKWDSYDWRRWGKAEGSSCMTYEAWDVN